MRMRFGCIAHTVLSSSAPLMASSQTSTFGELLPSFAFRAGAAALPASALAAPVASPAHPSRRQRASMKRIAAVLAVLRRRAAGAGDQRPSGLKGGRSTSTLHDQRRFRRTM